jgi:hypothetical protein
MSASPARATIRSVLRAPDTRFATNDGLTIAYQQFGEGDADVVFAVTA